MSDFSKLNTLFQERIVKIALVLPLESLKPTPRSISIFNCKLPNLYNNYTANVAMWNNTINKVVIEESRLNEWGPLLKLAGYPGTVKPIEEQELFNVLSTFKTDRCDVTIFSARKRVDIDDMPGIVSNIERIEGALLKIDEWTNPQIREPLVPQPAPVRPRIDPTPPRPEPKTNTNSSKKIIQRFRYQFKALAALVDDTHMEQARVDQAEA